jgi:hypothetical protein
MAAMTWFTFAIDGGCGASMPGGLDTRRLLVFAGLGGFESSHHAAGVASGEDR